MRPQQLARWRPLRVEEIYHRPDLWRIADGLTENDVVVTTGFLGLRDGMRVEVTR